MPHSVTSLIHLPTIKHSNYQCVCANCACVYLIRMYMHGWWETAVCERNSHQRRPAEEEKCLSVMAGLWGDVSFLSIRQGSCRRSCTIRGWLNSMSWRHSVAMEKIANYRASLHFSLLFLPLIINHFGFYCFQQ